VLAAARVLSESQDRSPLFILAGAGPMKEELERSAQDLPNVRFLPLQPVERFNEFLNIADIHLLPQRRDASDLVMPSKLLAMLASGRPVIATAPTYSEIARTLADAGAITPPEDPGALASAIAALSADPERRRTLGANAVHLARSTMHSETILRRIEAMLIALSVASTPAMQPESGPPR
jgi:colanic acid biosynthesis glycosyl transferase WcaI